jgi:hypothetical protein
MVIKDARALLSWALFTLNFLNIWEDGHMEAYSHFVKTMVSKPGQVWSKDIDTNEWKGPIDLLTWGLHNAFFSIGDGPQ